MAEGNKRKGRKEEIELREGSRELVQSKLNKVRIIRGGAGWSAEGSVFAIGPTVETSRCGANSCPRGGRPGAQRRETSLRLLRITQTWASHIQCFIISCLLPMSSRYHE